MSTLGFNKESIYQYNESISCKTVLTYRKVIYRPGTHIISGYFTGKADLNGARFRFVASDKGCSFFHYIFEVLEDRGPFSAGDHLLLWHKDFVVCNEMAEVSGRRNN